MIEDSVGKPQTRLARFVERKWRVSGQNQTDFVKSLMDTKDISDFGSQTLSKFIRGRLAAPPAGLIEALAKRYEVSIAELEDMAIAPESETASHAPVSPETVPELNFLIGHTVWAASFVVAMLDKEFRLRDSLRNIKIASRRCRDLIDGDLVPCWRGDVDLDQLKSDGGFSSLSAPTIIELLEGPMHMNETTDRVVTFGLLPWEMVADRQRRGQCDGHYVRLATLMDSTAATSVIVPSQNTIDTDGQAPNNTLAMGALVRWLARAPEVGEPTRRLVLGEKGSIAGEQARRIAMSAQALVRMSDHKGKVDIDYQDYSTQSLEQSNWETVQKSVGEESNSSVNAVIAWDPQATGVVKRSEGEGRRAYRYNLIDTLGKRGNSSSGEQSGPGHTTFDIVLYLKNMPDNSNNQTGWRENVQAAADYLFYEIMPLIARRLTSLVNLESSHIETEILKNYFGFKAPGARLSDTEIEHVFSNIRYVAAIDPNGLHEMRNFASLPLAKRI